MRTSKTIKFNQTNPPLIISRDGNTWLVKGHGGNYEVTRDGRLWLCECKAGEKGYLCRHVQAVTRNLAEGEGFDLVQFWSTPHEAERQNRQTVRFHTRNRAFWMTFANRPADDRRVWGMALPRIWESRVLFDDGTTRIFASHDGEVRYHASRAKGEYRPSFGKSCPRIRFELFEPWFKEVTA